MLESGFAAFGDGLLLREFAAITPSCLREIGRGADLCEVVALDAASSKARWSKYVTVSRAIRASPCLRETPFPTAVVGGAVGALAVRLSIVATGDSFGALAGCAPAFVAGSDAGTAETFSGTIDGPEMGAACAAPELCTAVLPLRCMPNPKIRAMISAMLTKVRATLWNCSV